MSGTRQVVPLLAWIATLGATLAGLIAVGETLPSPPVTEPSAWGQWFAAQPAVVAVFGLVRLLAIGFGGYLLASILVGTLARLLRAARLVRLADALTLPMVRRLISTAVGVSIATAAMTGLRDDEVWQTDGTVVTAEMAHTGEAGVGMASLGDADDAGVTMALSDAEGGEGAPAQASEDSEAARTVTAATGDHLWGLAAQALSDHRGAAPSDDEVMGYWQRLIEANRERLADPANPDLIYPGQEFVLPAFEETDEPSSA